MALKQIYLETSQQLREMVKGKNSSDFSFMIINEIALAIEHMHDINYVAGFIIIVGDLEGQFEITINSSHYRDTINANINKLVADERYEDCAFAMQILKRLDEIESENAAKELMTELNSELSTSSKKPRKKTKKQIWSEWDGELDFTK